jgi:sulfur-oxidizing protein SoxX
MMPNALGAEEQQSLLHYEIVGDAIPDSLTMSKGDPAAGRKIVVSRQSTCLLCHSGPFPEERFQGNVGPDLAGTGSRWSEGQLRLRIVNAATVNPGTIMPPFYRVEGLTRVHPAWRGKPILSAKEIEDVVAFLRTLRN